MHRSYINLRNRLTELKKNEKLFETQIVLQFNLKKMTKNNLRAKRAAD